MSTLENFKGFFIRNRRVLSLVLIWLVYINLFSLLAVNRFNLKADDAYRWIPTDHYTQNRGLDLTKIHSQWDSDWYLSIVKNGYTIDENNTLSNIVFFPIYPALIKTVTSFSGLDPSLSGWSISCVFIFLSAICLFKLATEFHKESDPVLSVSLMLLFPTAFFLNAVYTESLFLFLSVTSFYLTMKRHYFSSACIGLLASLTRITGVLLFVPLLIQLFTQEGFTKKAIKKSSYFLLIPIGLLSFFAFHWIRFGDFFLFFKIESAWGRSFSFNADHFMFDSSASITNFLLDASYFIFIAVISLILLRKKMFAYATYVISTVVVAVSTGTLMSIGRYILVLFPIYLVGASLQNTVARHTWILISSTLMALTTILFVNGYWAG